MGGISGPSHVGLKKVFRLSMEIAIKQRESYDVLSVRKGLQVGKYFVTHGTGG